MRRLLLLLVLALLGGAAAAGMRRLRAARPAGTPTTWPAVPRSGAASVGAASDDS